MYKLTYQSFGKKDCLDHWRAPRYAGALQEMEQKLREIVDPEGADQWARQDQRRRLDLHGGRDYVLSQGFKVPYTPAPRVE